LPVLTISFPPTEITSLKAHQAQVKTLPPLSKINPFSAPSSLSHWPISSGVPCLWRMIMPFCPAYAMSVL
jgi:hypothetical protein